MVGNRDNIRSSILIDDFGIYGTTNKMKNIFFLICFSVLISCRTKTDHVHNDSVDISYDSIHRLLLSADVRKYKMFADSSKHDKNLIRQLDSIFKIDQGPRNNRRDSSIVSFVTQFIDKNGWLGPDIVGVSGNMTLFLVIQHADINVQDKYVTIMRNAAIKGNAHRTQLALLEDRILARHNKKQYYGTQVGYDQKSGQPFLASVEDEINVNERRLAIGLDSLQTYLRTFKINYVAPTK